MRSLSTQERSHNNMLRFLGKPTLRATDYDKAKEKCRFIFGLFASEDIIENTYFLFTDETSRITPEEVTDNVQWRKCTDRFFGMNLEIYPEGRKLLSILVSPSYCMNAYKSKWDEFNRFYADITKTVEYINKHLPSTWSKLSKSEKLKKIAKLKRTIPFFDQYDFLQKYRLNQTKQALIDKLNYLKLPNLHEEDLYEHSALNIAVDGFTKYSPMIIKKIHTLFIDYYLEYQTNYKKLQS